MALLNDLLADVRPDGATAILKMAELCLSINMAATDSFLGVKVVWSILIRVIR